MKRRHNSDTMSGSATLVEHQAHRGERQETRLAGVHRLGRILCSRQSKASVRCQLRNGLMRCAFERSLWGRGRAWPKAEKPLVDPRAGEWPVGGEKAEERGGRKRVEARETQEGIKTGKTRMCTLTHCVVGMRERGELRAMDLVDGGPLSKTGNTKGGVPEEALMSVRYM